MEVRPSPAPEARRILDLARKDKAAAQEAVSALPLDAQVAMVCEAPIARRGLLLELFPAPEDVIPLIPDAELCFTVKGVGIGDASWILEYATPSQIVASVDLDAWSGLEMNFVVLDQWITTLANASEEAVLRNLRAVDSELMVRYLRGKVVVYLDPRDEEWQAPPGAQTLDGQFYTLALQQSDDVAALIRAFRILFRDDYWLYYRIMQGAIWELDSDLEEWALRWRSGRLEDLGFPAWDRAMQIYGYLRPDQRAELPAGPDPLDISAWHMPVWISDLPAAQDSRHLVFRTIAELQDSERQASFYAFIAISNKIAVADRMPLGEPETLPAALERAAEFTSRGLEFLAQENQIGAADVLRKVSLEHLFRVGASLSDRPKATRE